MATAAEQLHSLLGNQHNVLAQLEPAQAQLFSLVAKLKGISLEGSHAESKASFLAGMTEYREVLSKSQEAQAQLQALNVKFLRPGTNAGGEIDADEVATRTNEEDQFGAGLVAQLGCVSDAKFLDICNEQRDVVDAILNCSAGLREGLDRIIDGNNAEEQFSESDDTSSFFSDTEQSEIANTRNNSSEANVLQQELDCARAEILHLKSTIIAFERGIQTAPHIHTELNAAEMTSFERLDILETKKTEGSRTSAELKRRTDELVIANTKVRALEIELEQKKPLFNVGVKVRCGFLQSVKRLSHNDEFQDIYQPPPKREVITAKNEAVHRGNFIADKALFDLGFLKADDDKESFQYTYQIPSSYHVAQCPKALQLVNYRGTLMACGFLTKYSRSRESDKDTEEAFNFCKKFWFPLISLSKTNAEEKKTCLSLCNREVDRQIKRIMQITDDTVKKEQKRMIR